MMYERNLNTDIFMRFGAELEKKKIIIITTTTSDLYSA